MHSLEEFVSCTMLNLSFRYLRKSNIPEAAMKTKYYVLPGPLKELQHILFWSVGGFFAYLNNWNSSTWHLTDTGFESIVGLLF